MVCRGSDGGQGHPSSVSTLGRPCALVFSELQIQGSMISEAQMEVAGWPKSPMSFQRGPSSVYDRISVSSSSCVPFPLLQSRIQGVKPAFTTILILLALFGSHLDDSPCSSDHFQRMQRPCPMLIRVPWPLRVWRRLLSVVRLRDMTKVDGAYSS